MREKYRQSHIAEGGNEATPYPFSGRTQLRRGGRAPCYRSLRVPIMKVVFASWLALVVVGLAYMFVIPLIGR